MTSVKLLRYKVPITLPGIESSFLKCKQVEIIYLKYKVHKWPCFDSSFGIMLGCAEK